MQHRLRSSSFLYLDFLEAQEVTIGTRQMKKKRLLRLFVLREERQDTRLRLWKTRDSLQ